MNVQFTYLYRDAGNYKLWGAAVFSNKDDVDLENLEQDFRKMLIDSEFFYAERSTLPELSFDSYDRMLDHEWYEYHSMEDTAEVVNEKLKRDFEELNAQLKIASPLS